MAKPVALVLACLLATCLGCGGKEPAKIKLTGQLVKNSKPLKLDTTVMKNMVFFPYEEALKDNVQRSYPAMVEEDGSFEVAEIPPGKYLISLELLGGPGDLCNGLFAKAKSKLVREVKGGEALKIEITKPTGE